MERNQLKQKKLYVLPTLVCIQIEIDISLILQSQSDSTEPIWGPGEELNSI